MAYQIPKKDWKGSDVPKPSDLNRIEGNIEHLEESKETPTGAQEKANTAELVAKAYTDTHASNANNPHGVTKSQVGLSNVDNVKQAPNTHIGATGNAHGVVTTSVNGFMSAADKTKLNGVQAGAQVNSVTSVAGKTGAVSLVKADVGLSNVDNLSAASIRSGTTKADVGLSNVDNIKQAPNTHLSASGAHVAENISLSSANFTANQVKGALDELFTSVSNGKGLIATAITDKGVPTSGGDSFSTMAGNIGSIISSKVKSIQKGGTQVLRRTSLNISVSAVNMSKSFLIIASRPTSSQNFNLSHSTGGELATFFSGGARLTSSTQITFEQASDWGGRWYEWQLVELE